MSELFSESSSRSQSQQYSGSEASRDHDTTFDEEASVKSKESELPTPEPPPRRDLPKLAKLPDIPSLERRHSSASIVMDKPPLSGIKYLFESVVTLFFLFCVLSLPLSLP